MTEIRRSAREARKARVDQLIVPVRQHRGALAAWSPEWRGNRSSALSRALKALHAPDQPASLQTLTGLDASAAAVVTVVIPAGADLEGVRRAIGAAIRCATGRVAVDLAGLPGDPAELMGAAAAGAALGAYRYTDFRGAGYDARPVSAVTLHHPSASTAASRRHSDRAVTIANAVNRTRDLVNTPPSALTPLGLAERVTADAQDAPIKVTVTSGAALRKGGFGGITAVGQGSANPPALVRMHYRPKGAVARIAFVGKGITFDSGGLSLKTPQGMMTMKTDMAGAAAVAEATIAVAELGLPVEIVSYLACAENMPSGHAQRPGDVITIYGGKTVEVLNTDAEGRLVLADALVRAAEDSPDAIVDVATLTGAQVVALGSRIGGAMGRGGTLRDEFLSAAGHAGESFWPMPLPPELRPSLDSKIADLANIGERNGGMMTAAIFLAEFVPSDIPWVHLDIAGPSFNEGTGHGYTHPGGTGVAVRSLVQFVEAVADRGGVTSAGSE